MPPRARSTVLLATDGSAPASAAVLAATRFPWPRDSRGRGLVVRTYGLAAATEAAPFLFEALEQEFARVAGQARRRLRTRWPDAEVEVVGGAPVSAILAAVRRHQPLALVVGSRGHGALSRLVLGSVSLGVVRQAPCPVLVVRGRQAAPRHLLVGVDGSPHARRAVELVARLPPPASGRVTLLAVVEPLRAPSAALLPAAALRALQQQAAGQEARRRATARRHLDAAARLLAGTGWKVGTEVAVGVPLGELLKRVRTARAHTLILGARGVGGLARLLLGSVAEGALTRSAVPVFIVR